MTGFEVVYEVPDSFAGYEPITHLFGTRQHVLGHSIVYIRHYIDEVSSLQTFFDLQESDSDLKWMIFKGSKFERHYQELIPEYHIDSTCLYLEADGYASSLSSADVYNWQINGQEGTCDFTFLQATVTKFDLYTAKCEDSDVSAACTKQN